VRRRAFITLLGSAATWPLNVRAQQAERVRRIGMISGANDQLTQARVAAFFRELQQLGWTEGRNLHIDARCLQAMPPRYVDTRQNSLRLRPTSSSPLAAPAWDRCWSQHVRCRSYSRSFLIRSVPALSSACRGQAATRPAS